MTTDWSPATYPQMVPGGYISIVDYGNAHTAGVRVAVEAFVERVGCSIVTLPDRAASAWIAIPPEPRKDATDSALIR